MNNIDNIYSLTATQTGILYQILKSNAGIYINTICFKINSAVDKKLFIQTWYKIVANNETLRSFFKVDGIKTPIQIILKGHKPTIKIITVDKPGEFDIHAELSSIIASSDDSLDIFSFPPFYIILYQGKDTSYLILRYNHILLDGWSCSNLIEEYIITYNSLLNNEVISNTKTGLYKTSLNHYKELTQKANLSFWEEYLSEHKIANPKLLAHNGNTIGSSCEGESNFEIGNYTLSINHNIFSRLSTMSSGLAVSFPSILYAAWAILLNKLQNSTDVIFGSVLNIRPEKVSGIDKLVGLFINTLPVRFIFDDNSLDAIYTGMHSNLIGIQDNRYVSLSEIKKLIGASEKDDLFKTIFIVENYPINKELSKKYGINLELIDYHEISDFDLTVQVMLDDTLYVNILYNKKIYSPKEIQSIASCFGNVLECMAAENVNSLADIDIVASDEKMILANHFNTHETFCYNQNIVESIEYQSEKTPDKIAVVSGDSFISYSFLIDQIKKASGNILKMDISQGTIVGLMLSRNDRLIITMLALLKSRYAFLPIESNLPNERVQYIIKNSELRFIFVDNKTGKQHKFNGLELKNVDEILKDDVDAVDFPVIQERDMAYIMYTSGSTGNPKGVMISHRNLMSFIVSLQKYFDFDSGYNILSITRFSFDPFLLDTFYALSIGMSVFVSNEYDMDNPVQIRKQLSKYGINILQTTPSKISLIADYGRLSGRHVNLQILIGGEVFSENLFEKLKHFTNCDIYNLYGPTETTVWATIHKIVDKHDISIGKPLVFRNIDILNYHNQVQPIGVVGELCISGEGVSKGYINNDKTTVKVFVDNPVCANTKCYKTGDYAMWRADGKLEYIGRIDHQVKIRGHRIELGDIESNLKRHPDVKNAIIRVLGEGSNMYLSAVYESSRKIDEKSIELFLKDYLPHYMLPQVYTWVERLPINANGKIDKASLPQEKLDIDQRLKLPKQDLEIHIANIWAEILKIEISSISVDRNFFAYRGNSLMAIQLILRIQKEFKTKISLYDFYQDSTIEGLVKIIDQKDSQCTKKIRRIEKMEYYPLSSIQRSIYYLEEKTDTQNTIIGGIEISDIYSLQELNNAINKIIKRHESLRTKIVLINGNPVQMIRNELDFYFEYRSEEFSHDHEALDRYKVRFDPGQAHMFDGKVFRKKNSWYILFQIHHIVSDRISLEILIKEFLKNLSGEELSEHVFQYRDYIRYADLNKKTEEKTARIEFWKEYLIPVPALLEIPDTLKAGNDNSVAETYTSFSLDRNKLDEIQKQYGFSVFTLVFSSFAILLSKIFRQSDFAIGVPCSNRNVTGMHNMMGALMNTIPVKSNLRAEITILEYLKKCKDDIVKCLHNSQLSIEDIVGTLKKTGKTDEDSIFNVLLVEHENFNRIIKESDITAKVTSLFNQFSYYPLTLIYSNDASKLELKFVYDRNRIDSEMVNRFCDYFKNIFQIIISGEISTKKIQEIEILTEEEKLFITNKCTNPFNSDKEILIEKIIQKSYEFPDKIAIKYKDQYISYQYLRYRIQSVAKHLEMQGVGRGTLVGLCFSPSIEQIEALLSVMYVGGVFIPIEPNLPQERIDFYQKDSFFSILLTSRQFETSLHFHTEKIYLEDIESYNSTPEKSGLKDTEDFVYIIYTSGTTGRPKGIPVNNKNLVNYTNWFIEFSKLTNSDRGIITSSYSYDAVYTQIYSILCSGGELHVIPHEQMLEINSLIGYIDQNVITFLKLTPSLFKLISQDQSLKKFKLNSLQFIMLGGESIDIETVNGFRNHYTHIRFINHYGPTEATIGCIAKYFDSTIQESDSIGNPISGTSAFVLDTSMNYLPINVAGELYIVGEGVAEGYLNNPQLTMEKFVYSPKICSERMYKTGDWVKLDNNGEIIFLGRRDRQVKINGIRVELSEIEERIKLCNNVKTNCVIFDKDMNTLKCFVVFNEGNRSNIVQLKNQIRDFLPKHMIPSQIFELESIPLTTHKKIDYKALSQITIQRKEVIEDESIRENPKTVQKLYDIWKQVLGDIDFLPDASFFDIGGSSFKLIQLRNKINEELGINLKISTFFEYPTINLLAKVIDQRSDFNKINAPKRDISSRQHQNLINYQNRHQRSRRNLT